MTLVLAAVVAWSGTAPASAHTELVSLNPAAGSRIDAIPKQVMLTFTEQMSPGLSAVTARVDSGPAVRLDLTNGPSGTSLVATVPASITVASRAPSRWRIAYRVVSRDGHPVAGESTFTVRPSNQTPAVPDTAPDGTDAGGKYTEDGTDGDTEASSDDPSRTTEGSTPWTLVSFAVVVLLALLGLAVVAGVRLARRDFDS